MLSKTFCPSKPNVQGLSSSSIRFLVHRAFKLSSLSLVSMMYTLCHVRGMRYITSVCVCVCVRVCVCVCCLLYTSDAADES